MNISNNVRAVLDVARKMAADGKNTNSEVAKLVSEIGQLNPAEQKELFGHLSGLRNGYEGFKGKEPLDAFLTALRGRPAQLLGKLEKNDGVIDLKEALEAAPELLKSGKLGDKGAVSVRAMMLVAKMEPQAETVLNAIVGDGNLNLDALFREMFKQGPISPAEIAGIKRTLGSKPSGYDAYQINYWAQTTKPSDFAPGAQAKLTRLAAEHWSLVPQSYREDLELNRGHAPSERGALVLQAFAKKTLGLDAKLTLLPSKEGGEYTLALKRPSQQTSQQLAQTFVGLGAGAAAAQFHQGVNSGGHTTTKHTFKSNDALAAFLLTEALRAKGSASTVEFRDDPKVGSRYVLHAADGAERVFTFHSELMRDVGLA